jgi:hypothetical protein
MREELDRLVEADRLWIILLLQIIDVDATDTWVSYSDVDVVL